MPLTSQWKKCSSERLRELVGMDPLSPAYKEKQLLTQLDNLGQHQLTMHTAFSAVSISEDYATHKVHVAAKLKGSNMPWHFDMEIPTKHWEKLQDLFPAVSQRTLEA